MTGQFKMHQSGLLKIIHITDTHLFNRVDEVFYEINTKDALDDVLNQSLQVCPDADFVLITGDISQTGNLQSYKIFKSVISKLNVPVYVVPGNHDTPAQLAKVIPSCPLDSITIKSFGKYGLVLINSWSQGSHQGRITVHCIEQVKAYLHSTDARFIVFAVHHPPVSVESAWLDMLGLKNGQALLEVITEFEGDSILLCGHIHQELDVQFKNLRLLGTPSTCYQFKPYTEHMRIDAGSAPAYRLIKLNTFKVLDSRVHYLNKIPSGSG